MWRNFILFKKIIEVILFCFLARLACISKKLSNPCNFCNTYWNHIKQSVKCNYAYKSYKKSFKNKIENEQMGP
jgi:hypothetical protein